jgi:hypothetical protein
VALVTFSDLVGEAMERVKRDVLAAGLPDDEGVISLLRDGGTGVTALRERPGWGCTLQASASTACSISVPITGPDL